MRTSSHWGGSSYLPRLGIMFPDSMPTMVLFPMPLRPSRPITSPFLGTGSRYRRNELGPYWWTLSDASSSARFTIVMASNGHTLTQMPHPLQMSSSMRAFFVPSSSSVMQSAPDLLTGQYFMHSSPHLRGWQRSVSRTATLCVMNVCGAASLYTCVHPRVPRDGIRYVNRQAPGRRAKPAIASGRDPIPFRTWKSNLMSLLCY